MELSAADLGRLTGGVVDGDTALATRPLTGVTTDSRDTLEGGCFVAVAGERMDGHDFLESAVRGGAVCTVVATAWRGPVAPVVVRVPDTAAGLRRACHRRLQELGCTVVGITGSVGKTTAKEICAHVLGPGTARTPGNLNTWTGIPLTVLRLDPPVQVLVAEMGMSALGEIADLCSFTDPAVGVLLNVGVSHIELLGSREAIARAKAELLDSLLRTGGHAVVNGDDAYVRAEVARRPGLAVTWFSTGDDAGPPGPVVHATVVESRGLRGSVVRLRTPAGEATAVLPLPGAHLAAPAAAATAVALHLGRSLGSVVERLATLRPVEQRGAIRAGLRGATVIDDSYNAAPSSMAAALDLLAASGAAERIAVLGDMLELGSEAESAHREVGARVAAAATRLVAVGEFAGVMRTAALDAGMPADRATVARDALAAAEIAATALGADTAILVKASHGLHLEQVVERLVAEPA